MGAPVVDAGPVPLDGLVADGVRLVGARLRALVGTLPDPARSVAEYHFGWRDTAGSPSGQARLGKLVRARLALAACAGAGGNLEAGLPAAVTVELVHNFSLLHDDVMDGDPVRRHRPTAWALFGVSQAVLAGDCLLALATRTLAEAGTPDAARASLGLAQALNRLMAGQSLDLGFERREHVGVDQYLQMVRGKTGSLLGGACHIGALLAGAEMARAEHLRRFGAHLGIAFQMADDVLGIWGDPTRTGKPVGSDLAARKKTLPIIAALERDDGTLAGFYQSSSSPTRRDMAVMATLITERGGRSQAESLATEHHELALTHMRQARLGSSCERYLVGLADQCLYRDH